MTTRRGVGSSGRMSSTIIATVGIAGLPNSGKTTLFNSLTGLRHKVANYPGITVERREALITVNGIGSVKLVDLPGTYSLTGDSPDEEVAGAWLMGELPDERGPELVVCVMDACNLERSLALFSQLADLDIPIICVLNFTDQAEKCGIRVRKELLARLLQVPVLDLSKHHDSVSQLLSLISGALAEQKINRTSFQWCRSDAFKSAARLLGTLRTDRHEQKDLNRITLLGMKILNDPSRESLKLQTESAQLKEDLAADGIDALLYESTSRYAWASEIFRRAAATTPIQRNALIERLDKLLTDRLGGSITFFLIMALIFQAVFSWAEMPMRQLDKLVSSLQTFLHNTMPVGVLRGLLADGIVAGVGSVIVFVPQIALLYLFISILEESGYLARAAVLMDRVMRKFGLQGRSFVPMLSCFACAVPGIMATRSIGSVRDRMITIMVAPLMSCSARLPVYTLLIAAFIPAERVAGFFSLQGLVLFAMYGLGIVAAALSALLLRRTAFRGMASHFLMEMPPYRVPRPTTVAVIIWEKVAIFLKRAGTVILGCALALWFLSHYPKASDRPAAERLQASYLGKMGQLIEPLVKPLGFDWKIGVSILASFSAREVFVSSMAVVHNVSDHASETTSLVSTLRDAVDPVTGKPRYTALTGISLMVFYVLACQCISTLAVCRRETGSWRWPALMFTYMTTLAYCAAWLTYKLGSFFYE